jgi:hypothetical protein
MEDLIIFRIFLTFPFIGLLIPDAGILLSNSNTHLNIKHLIIEVTLLTCITVCSIGIWYFKRKLSATVISNNDTAIAA